MTTWSWLTPFSVTVSYRPDQWWIFWTLSLAIFPTLCNQQDSNPAYLEATVNVEIILEFFRWQLNGSMCAMSVLSFTRKCRDIIQVRWKTFTWFCGRFSQETTYQILSESPDFYRSYYEKTFSSLDWFNNYISRTDVRKCDWSKSRHVACNRVDCFAQIVLAWLLASFLCCLTSLLFWPTSLHVRPDF